LKTAAMAKISWLVSCSAALMFALVPVVFVTIHEGERSEWHNKPSESVRRRAPWNVFERP
jgi:hypothetical protein